MQSARKWFQGGFILAVFVGSLFMFQSAYASAYEWLTDLEVIQRGGGSCCVSDDPSGINWSIHTTGDFYEYRTVYTASTTGSEPPTFWSELQECRHEGVIDNPSHVFNDKCAVTHRNLGRPGMDWLHIRVTTNYAGCGTYTPNPDTVNCGDILQQAFPLH